MAMASACIQIEKQAFNVHIISCKKTGEKVMVKWEQCDSATLLTGPSMRLLRTRNSGLSLQRDPDQPGRGFSATGRL